MTSTPDVALQTVRALAGDAPLTLYVPAEELGQYQALAQDAGPAIALEADSWEHWIAGSKTTTLDMVPALGSAGARATDWQRWRWPLRLALLALVVNLVGLNVRWLRLKREADATRLVDAADLPQRLSERHRDPGSDGPDAHEHRARQGRQRPARAGRIHLPGGRVRRGRARPAAPARHRRRSNTGNAR